MLLALAVLWCAYWFVHAWHYWEDDAWIHLEFARSLSHGQGFAFNGHVVAGDTAPLWVLLLTGIHALVPNWIVAGKVLTIAGAAVGISGIYAFGRQLAKSIPALRDVPLFPALMVLVLVTNPFTCYWIFSGMESVAAAGLACWIVLFATQAQPSRATFLAGCALAGIAPLVRPEMTFLTALVALPLLGQWRVLPRSASKALSFLAGLILLCAPLAIWSIYSLHAFGHLLPNTNAAKRAGIHDSVIRHLISIYSISFPLVLAGAFAGVIYLVFRAGSIRRSFMRAATSVFRTTADSGLPLAAWIIILWVLITTVFYVQNHTYVQTRYVLVTAPAVSVVILAMAFMASHVMGRAVLSATLIVAVTVSLMIVRPYVRNKGVNCEATRDLAAYIRQNVPPNVPVAVFAIGEVAFLSEHSIVDTGGITQPEAMQYFDQAPEAMVRWTQSQGAQYWIGSKPEPDATLVYSKPVMYATWTLHPWHYDTTTPFEMWKFTAADQAQP